jgi:hypothetical protein
MRKRVQVIGGDLVYFNLFRERKSDVIFWLSRKPTKKAAQSQQADRDTFSGARDVLG